jgi:uncharacterized membrane protein YfcA
MIALATDLRTAVIVILLPTLAVVVASIVKGGHLRTAIAEFWPMPVYMLIGAALGTHFFITMPAAPFTLLLVGVILLYLNLDRLGRLSWQAVQDHRLAFGITCGIVAGIFEGTVNFSAPPLIIYFLSLGLAPTVLVQALNICFFAGKGAQFATMATAGGVGVVQWLATLPLAGLSLITLFAGIRVRSRVDADTYRRWLKQALFAMAIFLLLQYLYVAIAGH